MITTNGQPILPGVVAESSRGHYASMIVVGTALDLGWYRRQCRSGRYSYKNTFLFCHTPCIVVSFIFAY